MANTYHFNAGAIMKEPRGPSKKNIFYRIFPAFRALLCTLFNLLFSGSVVWYVFYSCVQVESKNGTLLFPLSDRISTGALFATFGSAVITVCTLFTSKYITRAYEDRDILMLELCADELGPTEWKRWPFVPRTSAVRFGNTVQYTDLRNASVSFNTKTICKSFTIPTTEKDFKELPLLFGWLELRRLRKRYLRDLNEIGEAAKGEYLAWDCTADIYSSALLYRIGSLSIWTGGFFVLQSILFVFLYPSLYCRIIGTFPIG